VCGEWLANRPRSISRRVSKHRQQRGITLRLMASFTPPFVRLRGRWNASIGKFFSTADWGSVGQLDRRVGVRHPAHSEELEQRRECPAVRQGNEVQMVWKVDGKTRTGKSRHYHQQTA